MIALIEDTGYFGFLKRENCDKRKEDAIYLYDDYKSFSKTQIVLIQVAEIVMIIIMIESRLLNISKHIELEMKRRTNSNKHILEVLQKKNRLSQIVEETYRG